MWGSRKALLLVLPVVLGGGGVTYYDPELLDFIWKKPEPSQNWMPVVTVEPSASPIVTR